MIQEQIRPFYLYRDRDETGMSGTGIVADGVLLPNGMAVMWWLKDPYSVGIYKSIEELERIHGHKERKTSVVIFK